jgi:hypothetical protein
MSFQDRPYRPDLASALAVGQGAFYLATGVWSLVHDRSFQAVTGPKVDVWLVKTVGSLVGVAGAVLLAAGLRRSVPTELRAIAAGSAAALATIDVVFASRGRIFPIYLADAIVEIGLVAAWGAAGTAGSGTATSWPSSG